MKTFSLITEGVTDQKVLKNILIGYFDDREEDNIRFTYAQPQQDETDKSTSRQEGEGGWPRVLKYCESEDFQALLPFTDYVIIQIDSDRASEFPLDITGHELVEELFEKIKVKLISLIREDVYEENQAKIFFAICISELECWLLPLHYSNNRKSDTNNCIHKLNQVLDPKLVIIPNNKNEGSKYFKISKDFLKRKNIRKHAEANPSFTLFLDQLEEVFNQLENHD